MEYYNKERKFIFIREDSSFLNNFSKIEEYEITQYYVEDIKFRKLKDSYGNIFFTKSKKNGYYTSVIDSCENEFLKNKTSNIIVKNRIAYKSNKQDIKLCLDFFILPLNITILEVEGVDIDMFQPHKNMIEVTGNSIYDNINIIKNNILTNIIIDGGDCAGKTTIIKELIKIGIVAQDRDIINICPLMFFHIDENYRLSMIKNILQTKLKEKKVIFLVNTDENEINKRLKRRAVLNEISEFDKDAFLYNKMYAICGENIKSSNFKLIYGNDKSVEDLTQEVKKWLIK